MKPPYDDLRSFISDLDEAGEVIKIDAELSPSFEIAAALRYLDRRKDKAILFNRVKGYTIPLIGNLFQNYRSIAIALGIKDSQKVMDEYWKRSSTRIKPEIEKSGPVKEVILKLKNNYRERSLTAMQGFRAKLEIIAMTTADKGLREVIQEIIKEL